MDSHEFALLASQLSAKLHNLALALCGNSSDADDLVQSTLERLYPAWLRESPDNPAAYARSTLVRLHVSQRRRLWWRREVPTDLPDVAGASGTAPVDERIMLHQALSRLPVRQRQAVVLRYLEDLPVAEVATLMQCSEGNVKRSAFDGLRALRVLFEPHQEGATR